MYVVSKVGFENDFNPPTSLNMIKLKEQRGKKYIYNSNDVLRKTSGSVPIFNVCRNNRGSKCNPKTKDKLDKTNFGMSN